eukprot:gene17981-19778_t
MGQKITRHVQPIVNGLNESKAVFKREFSLCCDRVSLYKKIALINREDFNECIQDLNVQLASACQNSKSQVCFLPSYPGVIQNWKACTKIGCFEVDRTDGSVYVKRVLSVIQFWKLRNAMLQQLNGSSVKEKFGEFQLVNVENATVENATEEVPDVKACSTNEQTQASPVLHLSTSAVFARVEEVSTEELECCICMERNSDVSLPCAHCFCKQCTVTWIHGDGDNHRSCPVCREAFGPDDEFWEMPEPPSKEEIQLFVTSSLPHNI